MSAVTPEQIFSAVEDQRSRLLNVLGVMQCMRIAVSNKPPPELEGAVALVEDNLQDILEALEELSLKRAIAAEVQP
jgi:hypothetical protein